MKKIFFSLLLVCVTITAIVAQPLLPLQKGMTVVTNIRDVHIVDTRTMGSSPAHYTMLNLPRDVRPAWITNVDKVYGVTIDDAPAPSIYATSTSCYLGSYAVHGRIHKIDGQTGAFTVFAHLPNTGTGLGNICYDPVHKNLFVTNMEDGKIYRVSMTGTILSVYDPFAPDNGAAGFPVQGEKIWGISYYNNRIYFARWITDMGNITGKHNEIHSVAIDPSTGNFLGTSSLEISIPFIAGYNFSSPVSSISFSPTSGNMLLAERTMYGNTGHCWNFARVLEYQSSGNTWIPSPNQFFTNSVPYAASANCNIGPYPPGTLGEGGAGYIGNQNVIATGSYLINNQGGLSIMPINGNGSAANADAVNYYDDPWSSDFIGCLYVDNNATVTCPDCIGSFAPVPGMRYVLSAWMKDALAPANASNYTNPQIQVEFTVGPGGSGGTVSLAPFTAAGQVIDGWQRLEQEFFVPTNAFMLRLKLICGSGSNSQPCLFDDIRVFPFDGSLKSYVYDPETLRLVAELDERNYATMYEYDEEGKLTRVKKETERGVMTVKESKNSTHKK